jgi:hypothetical protein
MTPISKIGDVVSYVMTYPTNSIRILSAQGKLYKTIQDMEKLSNQYPHFKTTKIDEKASNIEKKDFQEFLALIKYRDTLSNHLKELIQKDKENYESTNESLVERPMNAAERFGKWLRGEKQDKYDGYKDSEVYNNKKEAQEDQKQQNNQDEYDGYKDSEVYNKKAAEAQEDQKTQPTGGKLSSYEVNNREAEKSYARLRDLRNKPQLNEFQRQELEQLEKEWEHMDQKYFEQKYRKPSSRFSFDKKTALYVAGALGISSVFYGGYRWYKNRQNKKEQLKKRRELRSKRVSNK